MITIEELAVKHNLHQHLQIEKTSIKIKLQAFADEWLALNSSEPFGYWHVGNKYELSNFYIEKHDEKCQQCIKLFKANPINQALLESHKRLEEALTDLTQDLKMRADVLKQEDAQGVAACGNGVWRKANNALANIPLSLEQLL